MRIAAFLLLVATPWVGGCRSLYVPPALNVPLLGSSGEMHVALGTGTNGVDAQIAYAVTDHFAVKASASTWGNTAFEHFYGDLGAGFVTAFAEHGRFEAFAGVGGGSSRGAPTLVDFALSGQANGVYVRPYLQADVGMVSDFVDAAFVVSFDYVYYDFVANARGRERAEAFFIEPGAVVRVGYKWVKAEAQLAGIVPYAKTTTDTVSYFPLHFSIGVVGHFDFEDE